jgi:hypothetical protein
LFASTLFPIDENFVLKNCISLTLDAPLHWTKPVCPFFVFAPLIAVLLLFTALLVLEST